MTKKISELPAYSGSAPNAALVEIASAGTSYSTPLSDLRTGGLANVVEDTTPELGGDLDANSFRIFGDWAQEANNNTAAIIALGPALINGSDPNANFPHLQGIYGTASGSPIITFSDGNDLGSDMGWLTIERGINGKCNFLSNTTHTHGGFQFYPFAGGSFNVNWIVNNYPIYELNNQFSATDSSGGGVQLELNVDNPPGIAAANLFPGFIQFHANNSADVTKQFGSIYVYCNSIAAGSESSGININTTAGTRGITADTSDGVYIGNAQGGGLGDGHLTVQHSSRIHSATAIPAGGTAGLGYKFSSTSNFGIFFGSGAPSLAAAKGSLYLRSDGTTTNDRAYINTNGSTSWTAITTAT